MGLLTNDRVNIVITNYLLRYSYYRMPAADSLVSYGEIELPEGTVREGKVENKSVLVEMINKLIHEKKWQKKKLFFSLPDDTVVIRNIEIPASLARNEAKDYVRTQLGNKIYLPFSNPVIALDFLNVTPESEEYQQVLLYAYPQDKLTAFEEVFDKAGFKVIGADLTSLSVYRYYYQTREEPSRHVLLAHWNRDSLGISIFQEHKAIFTRYITIDPLLFSEQEANITVMLDDYILEINRIIDFYRYSITKGNEQIEQIVLSGDFPLLEEAQRKIADQATIPIDRFAKEELPVKYVEVMGLGLKTDG
ncbi:pilus assembly protein PilM [Virgibacillus halodenitrificans]|uniref:type IV pilus biogenesis protein PilM n=1 Tax=Virgibacillus halodenitrificans TaxID=1482 RepID=UPI00136A8749|nr:pilus assembly protein PilM [Virgibacillus halodenitrificans]MYL44800.1 pilus assembly protein PilM [Virgibacillus halodenitrificans]